MTLKDRWGRPLTTCPYGSECPAEQELEKLRKMAFEKYRDGKPVQEDFSTRMKRAQISNG